MKFTVDGKEFNVFVTELTRSAAIEESKASGDVKNGDHFRDIVGTRYNYSMTIATDSLSKTDYDNLYEILTAPVDYHRVILPYGRSTLEFDAYIETAEDRVKSDRETERTWVDLTLDFYSKGVQRRPT